MNGDGNSKPAVVQYIFFIFMTYIRSGVRNEKIRIGFDFPHREVSVITAMSRKRLTEIELNW
jgi:hypothetical protein